MEKIRVKKKLVKSRVKIHDRTQVEATFDYSLLTSEYSDMKSDNITYEVDTYFFIPAEIGLNKDFYNKENLYNDIRALIRLREPTFGFHDLVEPTNEDKSSPLIYLEKFFENPNNYLEEATLKRAINNSLMLGCIFSGYLVKRFKRIKEKFYLLSKLHPSLLEEETADILAFSREITGKAHVILKKIRDFRDFCLETAPPLGEDLKHELHNVVAFCSYRFRDFLTDLNQQFESSRSFFEANALAALKRRELAILRYEKYQFQKRDLIWISASSPPNKKERYLLRRRFLKKHIWSILYLNVRKQAILGFKHQLSAMLASGIAMAWYVGAQIAVVTNTKFDFLSFNFFNITSIAAMAAFVMAYVLKDRIKELVKTHYSSFFLGDLPDHFEDIYYQSNLYGSLKLGNLKEYTHLLQFSQIPTAIKRRVMELTRYSPQYLDEYCQFYRYRKKILLKRDALSILQHKFRKMHDVTRINVQSFVNRLDEVTQHMRILEVNGSLSDISMPKNYHVDLALVFNVEIAKKKLRYRTEYLRLILNKEGLVRIENLTNPSESMKDE